MKESKCIYLIGGTDNTNKKMVKEIEEFNIDKNAWRVI